MIPNIFLFNHGLRSGRILLVALFCLLFSDFAIARGGDGAVINIGIYYQSTETIDDPSTTVLSPSTSSASTGKSNTTIYDLNFGYVFTNKTYIGLLTSTRTDGSGSSGTNGSSYLGLSLGYHFNDSSYLHLHYLLNATLGSGSYTGGKGYGADFGFYLPLSGNAHVGVQLTYRQLTYNMTTYVASGNSIIAENGHHSVTEIYPMLVLGFDF